jgi:hypothetical protein
VLLLCLAECRWLASRRGAASAEMIHDGNPLARWIQSVLLRQKGISPETPAAADAAVQTLPCTWCLGVGVRAVPGGGDAVCPVCLGVGSHAIRRFSPAERICPACLGMGRAWESGLEGEGPVIPCPRCDGRGLLPPPAPAPAPDAP